MEIAEFCIRVRVEQGLVETWIEAGWLLPQPQGHSHAFSDIDLARAALIRDLKRDFGVNDEAVPIILDLVDQLHGVRRALQELHTRSRERTP